MELYIIRKRGNINSTCIFNQEESTFTVIKGSLVSSQIAHSEKFRGATSIENNRKESVKDNVVVKDIVFKSASTAANFVTGSSTNGLSAWKDKNGTTLKELLK